MSVPPYDAYLLFHQRDCDDPYYPPYDTLVGMFKTFSAATAKAQHYVSKKAADFENYKRMLVSKGQVVPAHTPEEHVFYVMGHNFDDDTSQATSRNKWLWVLTSGGEELLE